ncbi:helix-turn-helix transcriptional regulator [Pseudomonas aeruginosa]|uniref:helix-turn-helix domain-containing protein n=1 Tax=Pseudomonas aeruginosa TaxID=287 RepID=UPI0010A299C3|nr:helix-turn-helix transcriptional regulator [Pseudomonas aeruginosa]EKX1998070.1 helix-turn-helix transcriptional regulator [Pseudomonas aeruginosa]EKX8709407.1 helix-turn-helix transcriptional regulator [Pseudomonas aeruginosa]MBI8609439.1 helix-turn-helix transcriptional regulator [Pseudomonas aeruginosa]MCV0279906.1 helix-turn-helix domain-containing protein [Pseudomonas aeruginosa]MDY1505393.1 helix-turn-helix transcriptional regulator [Pseudomonas aeruginosa]
MELKQSFGAALKQARAVQEKTQEDFAGVSGRTYLSALERGIYSPTIDKIDALASVLELHPLTLVALCYMKAEPQASADGLLERVRSELKALDVTAL